MLVTSVVESVPAASVEAVMVVAFCVVMCAPSKRCRSSFQPSCAM